MAVTVRDVLSTLDAAFPFAWADPWDRVGLLAGDPGAEVGRVFVSLDPTIETLSRALESDAQVLLTHHPAYLEPPEPADWPDGGVVHSSLRSGVSLIACHTNLDRAPAAGDAAARALGLVPLEPLENSRQAIKTIVTYAPRQSTDAVCSAMAEAGAGRIGLYEGCAFVSAGRGRYTPLEGSNPYEGAARRPHAAEEDRIEVLCPPEKLEGVVARLRSTHPYDEPVVLISDAGLERGAARLGRLCSAPGGAGELGSLAEGVADRAGVSCRTWGDPKTRVEKVAFAPGSGRSLVPAALKAGADVLVTGELRYHDASEASQSGLAVIECGHDVSEWPMVPVLAAALETLLPGSVLTDERSVRWWSTGGKAG